MHRDFIYNSQVVCNRLQEVVPFALAFTKVLLYRPMRKEQRPSIRGLESWQMAVTSNSSDARL